jgi:hypothetical protein
MVIGLDYFLEEGGYVFLLIKLPMLFGLQPTNFHTEFGQHKL